MVWRRVFTAFVFAVVVGSSGLAIFGFSPGTSVRAAETSRDELAAERTRWLAAGIDDYRIGYRTICFCPPSGLLAVTVSGGAVVAATSDGEPIDSKRFDVYSVTGLFDRVAAALESGADSVDVAYDAALGFPRRIVIDQHVLAVDDEITIEVVSFERLEDAGESLRQVVELLPGWNLLGWTGGDAAVSEAVAPIADQISSLHVWDALSQTFQSYFEGIPFELNSLQTLRQGMGVWIFVRAATAAEWELPDGGLERLAALGSGFNLVAWSGPSGIPAADAVAPLGTAFRGLYVWLAAEQRFASFHADAPSGFAAPVTLDFGDGVWLDLGEPVTWSVPASAGMVGGLVTLGPLCPVQFPGLVCPDAPYEAALVILDVDGVAVGEVQSGADGRYRIGLAAGAYTIVPQSPSGIRLPFAGPVDVTVAEGRWTTANIDYDSGIR